MSEETTTWLKIAGVVVGWIGSVSWLSYSTGKTKTDIYAKLDSHGAKIKKQEERIGKVESHFSDEHGRPILMSIEDHRRICSEQHKIYAATMQDVCTQLSEIKESVKKIPALAVDIAELKGRIESK